MNVPEFTDRAMLLSEGLTIAARLCLVTASLGKAITALNVADHRAATEANSEVAGRLDELLEYLQTLGHENDR